MYRVVKSATMIGLDCRMVDVEADVGDGLPVFDMVGVLACEVREAKERVRTALRNMGLPLPPKRITINLSPADVKKEGAAFDLPIAVAVLCALGQLPKERIANTLVIGELSLNGEVNRVRGILPIVMAARDEGISHCLIPMDNLSEGKLVGGIVCQGVRTLQEAVDWLCGREVLPPDELTNKEQELSEFEYPDDFSDLEGQPTVRRAAEIAAAGFHNLLMIGPPGAGKTMIARRIPTILPPLSEEESLEITKIYSVAGLLPKHSALMTRRPFRAPHHTITAAALTGGGRQPRPGEVSLASRGVLFLDELTEFQKVKLDLLRQPLEDRTVMLARLGGTFVYPADFMLVAAMNPCKCGYYPDRTRCFCSRRDIQTYLGRVSQPLLDRMDLCVETPKVEYEQLRSSIPQESSATIRERVVRAVQRQKERYRGLSIHFNAELSAAALKTFCPLGTEEENLLRAAFDTLQLSARAYHRIIRVARTIADLEGEPRIRSVHLAEAIGYRSIDKKFWNTDQ